MSNGQALRNLGPPWWEKDPMPDGWRNEIRNFMGANKAMFDVCLAKGEVPRSHVSGGLRASECRVDFYGVAIYTTEFFCLCGKRVELYSTGPKNYGSKISMRKGVCLCCGLEWHLRSTGNLYCHPFGNKKQFNRRKKKKGS